MPHVWSRTKRAIWSTVIEQSAIIFNALPLSVFCRVGKFIFFELIVCKLFCPF